LGVKEQMEVTESRNNILNLADSFIEEMVKIRNTLRAMSISALILAPFAMGLAIYLITHPSFFNLLQMANDFGVALSVLLASVIGISILWIITGIKQYRLIDSWNKGYKSFLIRTGEIDSQIASGMALDKEIQE
jgi:hypothetical protein